MANVAGIDSLVTAGEEVPEFDVRVPLLSLPRVLRTRLETIPANIPYLFAEPALVEDWGMRLDECAGLKVGVFWQGNPDFSHDLFRSIPFRHFRTLAQVPAVCLISLQKGRGVEQLQSLEDSPPVLDLGVDLHDFVDTAAVMMNLDLLVTSDTAVAHLAGALGVPVWLATQYAADWRWLQDREDSLWYPTMRLFRQSQFGDWEGVFERVAAALRVYRSVIPKPHISLGAGSSPLIRSEGGRRLNGGTGQGNQLT